MTLALALGNRNGIDFKKNKMKLNISEITFGVIAFYLAVSFVISWLLKMLIQQVAKYILKKKFNGASFLKWMTIILFLLILFFIIIDKPQTVGR